MALNQAVEAGMFLATLGDARQDLKMGNFRRADDANFQSRLATAAHMDESNGSLGAMGGGNFRRRRAHRQKSTRRMPSSGLVASMQVKAQSILAAKLYKLTHHKALRPLWKNLARLRTLTTFNADQLRQFVLTVALLMHVFTKYNKRGNHLQSQLRSIFLLVFLPFGIPPMILLAAPILIFAVPLLLLVWAFSALNRQAKRVMEQSRQPPTIERRRHLSLANFGNSVGSLVGEKSSVPRRKSTGNSLQSTTTTPSVRRSSFFQRRRSSWTNPPTGPRSSSHGGSEGSEHSRYVTNVSTLASSSTLPSMSSWATDYSNSTSVVLVSSWESLDSNNQPVSKPNDGALSVVDTTPPALPARSGWRKTQSCNDTPSTHDTDQSLRRVSFAEGTITDTRQRLRKR